MIQINWADIKKDVEKQTWRIAKVIFQDDEVRDDAQEDETKASTFFILRFAEEGVALVRAALKDYVVMPTTETTSTDSLVSKSYWQITFSDTAGIDEQSLAFLIHKFVVDYILWRWCKNWAVDRMQVYKADADETLEKIKDNAFSLSFPTKVIRPEYKSEETTIAVSYE